MKKTVFIIWKALSKLSYGKLVKLGYVFLAHPFLALFSFYATYKSLIIIRKKYPQTHHGLGIGNAYRHALWSALIMVYCCKITSPEKASMWCVKITNLHEELFPNTPLEKKMDIHNNRIGIDLFMKMKKGIHRQFFETSFIVEQLDKKVKNAKMIHSLLDEFPEKLVYLNKK